MWHGSPRLLCSLVIVQVIYIRLGEEKVAVVLTCMLPCEGTCTFARYHASIAERQNRGC